MLLYWKIKVIKRPKWHTEVIVKTWGRGFGKISTWRDFEMYDEKGEIIALGTSEWVLIDTKNFKLSRFTDEMKNAYGELLKSVFEEEVTGKLKEPDNMQKAYEYTATRRDIDWNHHVNNINYLEFAYDAFPKDTKIDFQNFEIYYKKQIKLRRDSIYILFKYE